MSDQPAPSVLNSSSSSNNNNNNGKAGTTNYAQWSQITSNLINETEKEEKQEQIASTAALGLDGKHPYSQSEANERQKATEVAKTKNILDGYKKREVENVEVLSGLLGPVVADDDGQRGGKEIETTKKYVTRDSLSAGKRVLTITDTSGPGHIVLTQDLTHLECVVPVNATLKPKSYPNDAENDELDEKKKQQQQQKTRTVHGLIKLNLTNIHNATVIIRCKIITATMEITRCSNLTVRVEKEATIATVQCDLCQNLTIEFHDAPSGKNIPHPNGATTVFWGDDKDDRIYHAGVTNLNVQTYRDGYIDLETCNVSYKALGAIAVGNASPEEMQFVTSVVNGELITERVVRDGAGNASSSASGGGGGGGARAMTEREMEEVKKRKEQIRKAVDEKLGSGIRFEQKKKGGKQEGAAGVGAEEKESKEDQKTKSEGEKEAVEEELYASMSQTQIDSIISECDAQKQKGNDAFTSGEYAQAVLYYTLALDKTAELPDNSEVESRQKDEQKGSSNTKEKEPLEQLYPRHILLSNRSACFLKLGHHDKALCDATFATQLNPNYVKGVFRKGLALHAMGKYSEAVPVLGVAHRIEPKNKQIGQALQFAEVRLEKERRERGG